MCIHVWQLHSCTSGTDPWFGFIYLQIVCTVIDAAYSDLRANLEEKVQSSSARGTLHIWTQELALEKQDLCSLREHLNFLRIADSAPQQKPFGTLANPLLAQMRSPAVPQEAPDDATATAHGNMEAASSASSTQSSEACTPDLSDDEAVEEPRRAARSSNAALDRALQEVMTGVTCSCTK